MAITIRQLSRQAEKKMNGIIKTKSCIATKTKAIEYALEQYEYYKSYKDKCETQSDEIYALKSELEEIKEAIRTIKNII